MPAIPAYRVPHTKDGHHLESDNGMKDLNTLVSMSYPKQPTIASIHPLVLNGLIANTAWGRGMAVGMNQLCTSCTAYIYMHWECSQRQ